MVSLSASGFVRQSIAAVEIMAFSHLTISGIPDGLHHCTTALAPSCHRSEGKGVTLFRLPRPPQRVAANLVLIVFAVLMEYSRVYYVTGC